MIIRCKVCGHANTDQVTFCEVCGAELAPSPNPASSMPSPRVVISLAPSVADVADTVQVQEPVQEAVKPKSEKQNTEQKPIEQKPVETKPAETEVESQSKPSDFSQAEEANTDSADQPPANGLTPISGVPKIQIPHIPIPEIPIPDMSAPHISVESNPATQQNKQAAPAEPEVKIIDAEPVASAHVPPPPPRPKPPVITQPLKPTSTQHAPPPTNVQRTLRLARLEVKRYGSATGEMIPLEGDRLVVGRFDPSSGPVDIDLGHLDGQEHLSRQHAEFFLNAGHWYIRDLGSTNGVYIKPKEEAKFSPRLTEPVQVQDGDELAFGNLMLVFHGG